MLDLTSVPVVDNHCHPVLLNQQLEATDFRGYFTEAGDPTFPEKHIPNTVYYLWLLRQLATFYGCQNSEEDILAIRNMLDDETVLERFFRAANIDTLILDPAFPLPHACYTPERMGQLGHCRTATMLRLETLMQQLIIQYQDFDEVVERYKLALSNAREQGYCAFKSIVAYRTGLNISEWSKDQAISS
ncbi:MAG TPA: hypothetical protein VF043_34220, partial [Ktedonobacteraceae bacterium]